MTLIVTKQILRESGETMSVVEAQVTIAFI